MVLCFLISKKSLWFSNYSYFILFLFHGCSIFSLSPTVNNYKGFWWLFFKVFFFYLGLFNFSKSTNYLASSGGEGGMGWILPACQPSDRRGLEVSRASLFNMQTILSSPSFCHVRCLPSMKHFCFKFSPKLISCQGSY